MLQNQNVKIQVIHTLLVERFRKYFCNFYPQESCGGSHWASIWSSVGNISGNGGATSIYVQKVLKRKVRLWTGFTLWLPPFLDQIEVKSGNIVLLGNIETVKNVLFFFGVWGSGDRVQRGSWPKNSLFPSHCWVTVHSMLISEAEWYNLKIVKY